MTSRLATRFRRPVGSRWYLITAIISIACTIVSWQMTVILGWMPQQFIPSPVQVLMSGIDMVENKGFIQDVGASMLRIYAAFLLSAMCAIPLGLIMSSFKIIEALCEPLIDFIRYIPVPALAPLLILWTGIGEAPKLLILFFGTFFQLVLIVMDDADNVPSEYFDNARMLGASFLGLFRDVLVPALLPQIYDRLRITLGWCWTYLVIAELLAVERGVGHTLKEAQRFSSPEQMFVCFLTLGAIGLVSDYIRRLATQGFSRTPKRHE